MSNDRPSIDHTILSPCGKVSQRARQAALKREAARLFPPGFWDSPEKTEAEKRTEEAQRLRRTAQTLRELAARGMKRRAYPKKAQELEDLADEIEARQ